MEKPQPGSRSTSQLIHTLPPLQPSPAATTLSITPKAGTKGDEGLLCTHPVLAPVPQATLAEFSYPEHFKDKTEAGANSHIMKVALAWSGPWHWPREGKAAGKPECSRAA